jgi:hypothetical protein
MGSLSRIHTLIFNNVKTIFEVISHPNNYMLKQIGNNHNLVQCQENAFSFGTKLEQSTFRSGIGGRVK